MAGSSPAMTAVVLAVILNRAETPPSFPAMDALKLVALDRDDIEVVSTHLQDAVVNAADIRWRPAEQRVVVGLNRFDWQAASGGESMLRRRRAVLRFERVKSCRCRNVDPEGRGDILNLLAVEFSESDAPAGVVTLTFSGDAALRLEVECLEAELADLGPSWSTKARPDHPDTEPQERS
jgi:hypothetical protein